MGKDYRSNTDCVQRTNIQNLKAIHNTLQMVKVRLQIVFKERIYKIWKQFTTMDIIWPIKERLCSKNEYTKSESNSQLYSDSQKFLQIVFKERIYKIWKQFTTLHCWRISWASLCSKNEYTKSESNSQPKGKFIDAGVDCVQRTNIQNLKAIHNKIAEAVYAAVIVFKERIYKIWKQFTTYRDSRIQKPVLCSKNEYTKSESNSQHGLS